jgi:hypothetical protein
MNAREAGEAEGWGWRDGYFIALCDDPDQLDFVAAGYATTGYPLTAQAMWNKAAALRAAKEQEQEQTPPDPPVIWSYEPPPPTDSASSKNNGSLLPVIAVIGAGLALS